MADDCVIINVQFLSNQRGIIYIISKEGYNDSLFFVYLVKIITDNFNHKCLLNYSYFVDKMVDLYYYR